MYYLKQILGNQCTFNFLANYHYILNKWDIPYNILNNTNIFIYQQISSKYNEYSTDDNVPNNIMTHIPKNCVLIRIPYVYASWLFSISYAWERDATFNFNKIDNNGTKTIYINKEPIEKLKMQHALEEILQLYDEGKIDFEYKNRFERETQILREKEKTCNVKIVDFIIDNYKNAKLFTTHNHPTYIIIKEMSKQIIQLLNIEYDENLILNNNYCLPGENKISSYDILYHNFNFNVTVDDDEIKKYIIDIYNNF